MPSKQHGPEKRKLVTMPFKQLRIAEPAAGLEVTDVILAIDWQPRERVDSFIDLVSALPSGKKVSLTVLDHRTRNTGNIFVVMR